MHLIVCEKVAILSRVRWVKWHILPQFLVVMIYIIIFLIDSPKSILTYLMWLSYSDRTAPIPRSLLISVMNCFKESYIDGLVQECSISSALAMEILQSCPKIWIWCLLIGTMLHILFESLLTCRGEVEINAVFIQCVPLAAGIHQHPKQFLVVMIYIIIF